MASLVKIAPSIPQNGHKSLLRTLREERKISQRKLADKLGIPRNQLVRLENKAWKKISLGNLESISHGLDIQLEELFFHFYGTEVSSFTRASGNEPVYTFEVQERIKVSSLITKREDCFIGIMEIPPQKTFSAGNISQGNLMFAFVMDGKVSMTRLGKERVFGVGECFSMIGRVPYELYTAHQFKPSRLMIVMLSAFIH